MNLDPRIAAEAIAPPPGPPPPVVFQAQTPALAVPLWGDCRECGSRQMVRLDGKVRAHRQHRVGRDGPYVSGDHCPGSGEPPEEGLFDPDSREDHTDGR